MKVLNSSFHILIVDDNPENLQLLMSILCGEQYEIHVAQNGTEALKKAHAIIPDLILLDIIMPGMDGFETCKELKSSKDTEDIPIIFLTALTDTADIVKGFEKGGVDYLTKPFNSAELLARVRTQLELRAKENELRKSYQTIKTQKEQLIEELEQARTTQLSLLPLYLPDIPNARVAAKYVPMEEVGGDFYDVFELEPNVFGLLVADVTGHGVSAALLSFMFYSIFSNARNSGKSTELTVRLTNEYLTGKIERGKFATLFYAIYNASTRQLTYTGAGHPNGFIIRPSSDEIIELHTEGILVGFFSPQNAKFEEKTIQLHPKDKVLLYTNGIIEVLDDQEEMLGSARLKSFLLENKHGHIEELLEQIYQLGNKFCEYSGFGDDITMIGLEVT